MKFKVFDYTRTTGGILSEYCNGNHWWMEYTEKGKTRKAELYDIEYTKVNYDRVYLGHTLDEVIASGRDILGEELSKNGEISYSDVKGVLPPITEDAYCFLGGAASHAGVTVDTMGIVFPQLSGRDRTPHSMFEPVSFDAELGSVKPRQKMLESEYPVLISVHEKDDDVLEFIYFVEPGDPDRDPTVWIRAKKYNKSNPSEFTLNYLARSFARELTEEEQAKTPLDEHIFLEALADTVAYWIKFAEKGSTISLPEPELEHVARGAMAFTAATFTADKPHYGHKFYGKELHDNFPPNYIWSIEAALLLGHTACAKRIFEYMLNYALNDEGRFNYRQGRKYNHGTSAVEYSILIFLAERYKKQLGLIDIDDERRDKLLGMGNILLSNCRECPEFGNKVLVKMCAEADNNERIHVYLNNNLWTIRGLRALTKLLGKSEYAEMADTLEYNIHQMIEAYCVRDTRFGDVVPFRFGYPTPPLTLSTCKETARPLTEEENQKYFIEIKDRYRDVTDQDMTENTYSNYRYYPEALSSMLLDKKHTDAIVNMRENIGGELLGMTRFRLWVDNWPVLHYARFLIETGKIEKYLMLLYAHTALHGIPELICYYEQIKLFGKVSAADCVPSLLTTPTMIGWMFAHENMDSSLTLLGALPKDWYSKPFAMKKIGFSGGTVDIVSDGKKIIVDFSDVPECEVKLVWRADNIIHNNEYIHNIDGNVITLKSGIKHAEFSIN